MNSSPQDIESLLTELKALPDFDRLVFPKEWYKTYHIPTPSILSMDEFLTLNTKVQFLPSTEPFEIRPPAEGGVRTLPELSDKEKPDIVVESKPLKKEDIASNPYIPVEITDYIDTSYEQKSVTN